MAGGCCRRSRPNITSRSCRGTRWRSTDQQVLRHRIATGRLRHDRSAAIVARPRRSPADTVDTDQAVAVDALHASRQRGFDVVFRRLPTSRTTGRAAFNTCTTDLSSAAPRRRSALVSPSQAGLNLYYSLPIDRDFSLDRLKANFTPSIRWTGERVTKFSASRPARCIRPVVVRLPGFRGATGATGFSPSAASHRKKSRRARDEDSGRVRLHVPDLTLTIVGTWDRHSRGYHRSLTSLAGSMGPWIEFRDNLARDDVRG